MADFPVSFDDLEAAARAKLSKERFAYVASGAGSGTSVTENVEELKRWKFVPRTLRSAPNRSSSTKVLGVDLSVPFMLAPVRGLAYIQENGEEICARAASNCAVPLVLSNLSSATPEVVSKLMGKTPKFFQLYPCNDQEITDSFIRRAERAGYQGIVLTVDVVPGVIQYSGPRTSEYQNYGNEVYLSDPVFLSRLKKTPKENLSAAIEMIHFIRKAQFTWEEVERIRRTTTLPIVLKGVLNSEDALEAIRKGVQGIVVSNHGGRSIDATISPIEVLPQIREAVGDRLTVLCDGGIHSGYDVVKVLALGADAALVGRAYVYALAVAGEHGVESLLRSMIHEIDIVLSALGCSTVAELEESFVSRI